MFSKILIANRGEIAVRIARTCRELGIATVALYEPPDESSLHLRVADECVLLDSPRGFMDAPAIWDIARAKGVDAIHPGYGFLAESPEFSRACSEAGITFIAPPVETLETARAKIETLGVVRDAGFNTVQYSNSCVDEGSIEPLRAEANEIGYPVIVKSCLGGRGRGERVVRSADQLESTLRATQAEGQAVYGTRRVFLEKLIPAAHQVGVQLLGDSRGNYVHLGEREGSLLHGNQVVLGESPAPCLNQVARARLCETAVELARLLRLHGVVTIEFLVDSQGVFYFTEIKPRIQIDHPLTELRARLDLVREQIRLAAGEPLGLKQDDLRLDGWAMLCRINAQDPQQNFLPSPGRLRQVRFPNGPESRMDTYVYSGARVPEHYDPLIAKLCVWGQDRAACLARLQRALRECTFNGIATNLSWLQRLAHEPAVVSGTYSSQPWAELPQPAPVSGIALARDLAVAAALFYLSSGEMARPAPNERLTTKWHRASRTLPE